MAKNVYPSFCSCACCGLSSLIVAVIFMLSLIPQPGICVEFSAFRELGQNILHAITTGDKVYLTQRFDDLEKIIDSSEDPFQESRAFLNSFIEQINIEYGLSLTLHDACTIIYHNIYTLQLPQKDKNILLATVSLFESKNISHEERYQEYKDSIIKTNNSLSWPWKWNWFGLNKKKHSQHKELSQVSKASPHSPQSFAQEELPGNIYAGGAELLAAGLACILGTVFPPAYTLAGGLFFDGLSRVLNGCAELDKQRAEYTVDD